MSKMLVLVVVVTMTTVVVGVIIIYTVETPFTSLQFKVFLHLMFSYIVLKSVILVLNFLQLRFFLSL
jgi:hypothetical protein